MQTDRFIKIDKDGFICLGEERLEDNVQAKILFINLTVDEDGRCFTTSQNHIAIVEYFDAPIVAHRIKPIKGDVWSVENPYEIEFEFKLNTLYTDEWDRFHGKTNEGVPFVLTDNAQDLFFNKLDSFTDQSIIYQGKEFPIENEFLNPPSVGQTQFWDEKYIEGTPGWELNEPAPALVDVMPQLKLPKSRVIVLGCGSGNDAAHFAEQGHIVTAVDFSDQAIFAATEKYGHLDNLKFLKADIFDLPEELNGSFDIVFEHTCYVAIDPAKRRELINIWRRLLVSDGHLLGIFFLTTHRDHPPFAGTEWELDRRLGSLFQPLYWTRWRRSPENRQGRELVVYSQKKPLQ